MKVYTRNEFTSQQREILWVMMMSPIETIADYEANYAYWKACNDKMQEQLADIGGKWHDADALLLKGLGNKLVQLRPRQGDTKHGIDSALLRLAELHPLLSQLRPEFIE